MASPSASKVKLDCCKPRIGLAPSVTLQRARKAIGLVGSPTRANLTWRGSRMLSVGVTQVKLTV
jgi:hypothetical protein